MTREEELKAQIERLEAQLNPPPPPLMLINRKPVKIVGNDRIGRGVNFKKHKRRDFQYIVPVVIVSEDK